MENNQKIILTARLLSIVFRPFYLPLVGLITLFVFSYMRILPFTYKLTLTTLFYLFTILIPTLLIYFYRRYRGWTHTQLMSTRERRMIPYLIAIICYFTCYYLLTMVHVPRFITSILMAALAIQTGCALINIWWKISTHMAGIGGMTGATMAFALIFGFDPIGWLCLLFLIAGSLGSARMILMQHTLHQVTVGFLVGCTIAVAIIL